MTVVDRLHEILVDEMLRTTGDRIFAGGDVVADLQFTHVANYHAGIVIRKALFRIPVKVKEDIIVEPFSSTSLAILPTMKRPQLT